VEIALVEALKASIHAVSWGMISRP
jgi:hypothetical protein